MAVGVLDRSTGQEWSGAAASAARVGTGLSLIAAPLLLAVGLAIHPEETEDATRQLEIVVGSSEGWDLAHCLVLLGSALFIPAALGLSRLLRGRGAWFGLIGVVLTGIGAVYFGALVGAAFTLSAAATLPAADRAAAIPAIQATIDREGPLALVLIGPIGIVAGSFVLGLGLWLARATPRWASGAIVAGAVGMFALIVVEADAQAIAVAAAVLTAGMAAAGVQVLRVLRRAEVSAPAPRMESRVEPA